MAIVENNETNNGIKELQAITHYDTIGEQIEELRSRRGSSLPDLDKAYSALNIDQHEINDRIKRPDKRVVTSEPAPNGSGEIERVRIEPVGRIAVGLQKLIIKRAVSFVFGIPVKYNATEENETQKEIMKAFNRILKHNKTTSLDRKIGRNIFSFKEAAEVWSVQDKPNIDYGFNSQKKLRVTLLTPENSTLYPYFDNSGDMVAFSREFTLKDKENKTKTYFETYTDEYQYLFLYDGNTYILQEGYPKKIGIGKIPVVYGRQDEYETQIVDRLISRLETLLSNFADTNDYHGSPKIAVKGELKGFSKKGETGAILELDEGADASYLAWQQAPESIKLEIETLLKLIYTLTQTPDISFDSVKGIGSISGAALKLLFMDAHLKVQDKKEIFDEYLQRRANIIKAYLGNLNTKWEKEISALDITPEITPYIINSDIDEVNKWLAANGNKPLVSHEASVKAAALTTNPENDLEKIKEEQEADSFNLEDLEDNQQI